MDLIAEIVLCYSDNLLAMKLKENNIRDYKIVRYRDDYRIFSNDKEEIELITRLLSDILSDLNLKLNSNKTKFTDSLIIDNIKKDKLAWNQIKPALYSKYNHEILYNLSLQKHLLILLSFSKSYPNSGSLTTALTEIYKNRIYQLKTIPEDIYQIIGIVVDIMVNNLKTVTICISILSKMLSFLNEDETVNVVNKIMNKLHSILNTDMIEIWLQRLSINILKQVKFESLICRLVSGEVSTIFDSSWLDSKMDDSLMIDQNKLQTTNVIISVNEVDLFSEAY